MTFETAQLAPESPFELRVRTFGGTVVSRHSADRLDDGRYVFQLGAQEVPLACTEWLGPNRYAKGHAKDVDGFYEIVDLDCAFCKRKKDKHVIPGQEVRAWLRQMPDACKRYWEREGCDGSGLINLGGDDVQGYVMECNGCSKCSGVG